MAMIQAACNSSPNFRDHLITVLLLVAESIALRILLFRYLQFISNLAPLVGQPQQKSAMAGFQLSSELQTLFGVVSAL